MAILTDKEQPLLGAIGRAGIATARACLTGVVGVHFHTERAREDGLIVQEAVQLGKRPCGSVAIGPALLFARLLALLALRSVSDTGQGFQTDERMGVGVQDVLTDGMVRIQLQPSLSLAQDDTSSCRTASAFSLKPLLEASIMIGFATYFLSREKLCVIAKGGNCGKGALAYVNTYDAGMAFGCGVGRVDGQAYQQIEALPAAVIPEFGRADGRPLLQERYMLLVALIGHDDSALKRQDADLLLFLQGIIAAKVVGERRGDVLGRIIQSLKAALRISGGSGFLILAPFGPQPAIGGPDLSGDIAGHLRRQAKLAAHVRIGLPLQPLLIARLAVCKRVGTDVVQGIAVGENGLPQRGKLVRRRQ